MRKESLVVAFAVAAIALPAGAQAPIPIGSACVAPAGLTFGGAGIPVDQLICATSAAGVQLILSATPRLITSPAVTETAPGSGLFLASTGVSQASPVRSVWNFDYAIFNATNSPTDIFTLLVDADPGFGTHNTSINTALLGSQNSENLGFTFLQSQPYDPNANGIYTIELDDNTVTGALVNRVRINVQVGSGPSVTATPEPASVALMATGLIGLGGFVRRRNKRAAA